MFNTYNLLDVADLDPPMGDLFSFRTLSECRSVWTAPLPGENGAPQRRIIHCRAFTPAGRATVERIGFRNAQGYHKCGSHQEDDWIVDLRILTLDAPDQPWRELRYLRDLPSHDPDGVQWLELDELQTYGLILEIRRCGIDGWWTPWNLAEKAFAVEGRLHDPVAPRNETLLSAENIDPHGLPRGLHAEVNDGQIRYRSAYLEIGFCLSRTGLTFLGLDQDGAGATAANLLATGPGSFHHGVMLSPIGAIPVADPAVRFRFEGKIAVAGNTVRYELSNPRCGQRHTCQWTVFPDRIELETERSAERPLRAWRSAAWRLSFRAPAAAVHVMGRARQEGQSGSFDLPAILHAPGHGSFDLNAHGHASARLEVFRPRDRIELELKTGEVATDEGDWLLPAGRHQGQWTLQVARPRLRLRADAPTIAKAALSRAGHTGLNFRPDTATLSNNGASMHCPISMDTWSCQCVRMGEVIPGLQANDLLRQSLERWLDGGPGYAAGNLKQNGELHSGEDEYLMTGTAALLGLAEYLVAGASDAWLERSAERIERKLEQMKARDLDDDGLIESAYRTGVAGSRQWSTCWYDVVSYGWKDAFSNALLFEALGHLSAALDGTALSRWTAELAEWHEKMRATFFPTFFNESSGWLAGWRCRGNELHDHAFLAPNGAAVAAGLVEPDRAKSMLRGLLQEMDRVQMPSARFGLPGNLRPIPDHDLSDVIQGYPFGYYQNGGRTHAQARHFLRGLYAVGLTDEADRLLEQLCEGLASAEVFGGCKSGVDWRYWDDRPCGYEGLLTDQFGVIGLILERYGR